MTPPTSANRTPGVQTAPVLTLGSTDFRSSPPKLWRPKQAIFTPAALDEEHGQAILGRVEQLGIEVVRAKSNRITGLTGDDVRATYRTAKRTLAVVTAPPSAFKLQPIPPSADWQFHIAEGCPGHCQYCYLAGSLAGPPVVRTFANLPAILGNLGRYVDPVKDHTSFECSCYTDPLAIEHLTGGLALAIEHIGQMPSAHLRWTTKYDAVEPLLDLAHNGRTRVRFSVNAAPVAERFEGGTAKMPERLAAAGRVAAAGYPLGFTVAPIMAMDRWQEHYGDMFDDMTAALAAAPDVDLTFELITHRFTPGSKDVLQDWYPQTKLDMDESKRTVKTNKFGGKKYVYPKPTMTAMRAWFEDQIAGRFPQARVLYWT